MFRGCPAVFSARESIWDAHETIKERIRHATLYTRTGRFWSSGVHDWRGMLFGAPNHTSSVIFFVLIELYVADWGAYVN